MYSSHCLTKNLFCKSHEWRSIISFKFYALQSVSFQSLSYLDHTIVTINYYSITYHASVELQQPAVTVLYCPVTGNNVYYLLHVMALEYIHIQSFTTSLLMNGNSLNSCNLSGTSLNSCNSKSTFYLIFMFVK